MATKGLCACLAALVLTAVFGLPFREYDTAKLLPIETLQVASTKDGVKLVSEVGEGQGKSFRDAVKDLKKNASGDVFFDTAEHLLLCDEALLPQILESGLLRPAANVYFARELQAPEGLAQYLSAHPSKDTIASLRAKVTSEGKGAQRKINSFTNG